MIFQKTWKVLPAVVVLASLLTVAYYIYVPMEKAIQEKPPAPPEITATANSKEEPADQLDREEIIPSTGGRVFAFFLLILALAGVIAATCAENPWPKSLAQPVFVAMAGVVVFCALMNIFIYPAWRWVWDHQLLFWGTSLSVPLYAYSRSRKESWIKSVAGVIAFLVLCGFVFPLLQRSYTAYKMRQTELEKIETKREKERNKNVLSFPSVNFSSYDDAPPDKVFPIIGGCESGDGTPGSGRQFEIKNGEKVVVRGRKNPNDVGYLQINTDSWADLIKKHPEIDIARSEEDNIAMAELIRQQKGYQPWYLSQSCWGPQLASLGYGHGASSQVFPPSGAITLGKPSYPAVMEPMNALTAFNTSRARRPSIKPIDKTVEAPIGESWSHATPVPFRFKQIHLNGGDKRYTVRWNNGVEENFPTPEGATPKTPDRISSLQVKSRESEPMQIRIRIF